MTNTKTEPTVKKDYFTMIQMRNALIQIEDQMVHSAWMPSIILGINRGGCIPGVYLSHRINTPHEVLDVRLRDHTTKPNLSVLEKAFAFQKKILIIDNINSIDIIEEITLSTTQHIEYIHKLWTSSEMTKLTEKENNTKKLDSKNLITKIVKNKDGSEKIVTRKKRNELSKSKSNNLRLTKGKRVVYFDN